MNLLQRIRTSKFSKPLAVLLAILLVDATWPGKLMALTTGPSQPEVQSFEPISTTEMVDPFSGDFNYNLPLMQVGNYPINIAYHSGITMDQEASWTGLGWNINAGVINRGMRGLPDDFNQEDIEKQFTIKDNNTYRLRFGGNLELFSIDLLHESSAGFSIHYNNYMGVGFSAGVNFSAGPLHLDVGFDTQSGLDVSPGLSLESKVNDETNDTKVKHGVGIGINSRRGLSTLTLFAKSKTTQKGTNNVIGRETQSTTLNSFSASTFVPQVTPNMTTESFSVSVTPGGEAFGAMAGFNIGGSYSKHKLTSNTNHYKGIGYLYMQGPTAIQNDAMLDFNREKETNFNKNTTKFLPSATHTFDIYTVVGQGLGGSYRPYRGNIGMVHDPKANNYSLEPGEFSLEVGAGGLAKLGGDVSITSSESFSGAWTTNFAPSSALNYDSPRPDLFLEQTNAADSPAMSAHRQKRQVKQYESVYFKQPGELVPSDEQYYNQFGGARAVRLKLDKLDENNPGVKNILEATSDNSNYSIPSTGIRKTQRDRRGQMISYLTAIEAKDVGFQKQITYLERSPSGNLTSKILNRVDGIRKPHHLSEISVTKTDGSRYYFGLPAYNISNSEYSFSVTPATFSDNTDPNYGLVNFTDQQASLGNSSGRDQMFSKVKTPAYAHSFLLTAMVSADYVDITGDGPSSDDLGNYSKFNYQKLENNFNYRTPVQVGKARYNKGLRSDDKDDKGTIVHGERETWYLYSVESKDQIAIFYTSDRIDGLGVKGAPDSNIPGKNNLNPDAKLQKLDKIVLYSKAEYLLNGEGATPIKSVHFLYAGYNYSYSEPKLCQQIPNVIGTNGKLTLSKIYFTYGHSQKGQLSPYHFSYSSFNPNYNINESDRWGNYKKSETTISNADFPYVKQNKIDADQNASAWNLTQIDLPSGGTINVDYESDDYAYVQNKRAMQMLKVAGVAQSSPTTTELSTLSTSLYEGYNPNLYVAFDLPYAMQNTAELRSLFEDIDALYFNFLTFINFNQTNDDEAEYLAGYFKPEDINNLQNLNFMPNSNTRAFIKVKRAKIETGIDGNYPVNPVSKAGWQFARLNTPRLIYPGQELTGSPEDVFNVIFGLSTSIISMIYGFNQNMILQQVAKKFVPQKSWIRLNAPKTGKLGGGSRVKKISMNTNWSEMTDSPNGYVDAQYGQYFSYTKADGTSSGVASYEPLIGGDENPFRLPLVGSVATEDIKLGPDNQFYVDGPIGESYFPGANVGYSRVTVRNITPAGVAKNGTGRVVHEFYTAFDFPTLTYKTEIDPFVKRPQFIWDILNFKTTETAAASQGYAIETNDMHGKPKSQFVYAQSEEDIAFASDMQDGTLDGAGPFEPIAQAPLSGVYHVYQMDGDKLKNEVPVIDRFGRITIKTVGKEIDMVVDTQTKEDRTIEAGVKLNVDVIPLLAIPLPIPLPLPLYSQHNKKIRLVTCTKVIQRTGINTKTIVYKDGSRAESTNLLWDEETGDVVLTSTQNEFNQNVYSLNYPAYWAYDGMGAAYRNQDTKSQLNFTNGLANAANNAGSIDRLRNLALILHPGDELMATTGESYQRYWVLDTDPVQSNASIRIIDRQGQTPSFNSPLTFKVIRSGRRNQLDQSTGSVSSLVNPIVNNSETGSDYYTLKRYLTSSAQNDLILNASSTEFSDKWQMVSGEGRYASQTELNCTPTSSGGVGQYFADIFNELLEDELVPFLGNNINIPKHYFVDNLPDNSNIECANEYQFAPSQFAVYSSNMMGCSYVRNAFKISLHGCGCGTNDKNFIYFFPVHGSDNVYSLFDVVSFSAGGNVSPIVKSILDDCIGDYALMKGTKSDGSKITYAIVGQLGEACPIIDELNCVERTIPTCVYPEFPYVNPYVNGIRGNWKAAKSYVYNAARRYKDINGNPLAISQSGTFDRFESFWGFYPTSGEPLVKNNLPNKWTLKAEITKVNPYGFDVENVDVLGRYSSALYGYGNSLPIAVANNASYGQIAFDGFEDYGYEMLISGPQCSVDKHLQFEQDIQGSLSNESAHSGRKSLKIGSNSSFSVSRNLPTIMTNPDDLISNGQFFPGQNSSLGLFSPSVGKYVISSWVKSVNSLTAFSFKVKFKDASDAIISSATVTITPDNMSNAIEGWVKAEKVFDVPEGAVKIVIEVANTALGNIYFDDLRVHPFNASMKTFVYDPISLRLMAQLDDNNYASFYEYDEQGTLVRTKKETARGVITLQENRQNQHKN